MRSLIQNDWIDFTWSGCENIYFYRKISKSWSLLMKYVVPSNSYFLAEMKLSGTENPRSKRLKTRLRRVMQSVMAGYLERKILGMKTFPFSLFNDNTVFDARI